MTTSMRLYISVQGHYIGSVSRSECPGMNNITLKVQNNISLSVLGKNEHTVSIKVVYLIESFGMTSPYSVDALNEKWVKVNNICRLALNSTNEEKHLIIYNNNDDKW